MSQGQVWRKRSAGLAGEYKGATTTWMRATDSERATSAAVLPGQRKAGMKRRKY